MNPSSGQQFAAEQPDDYDDVFDEVLPQRTRASYLTPLTALLMALILGGVGFYVGIRVEKAQASSGGAAGGSSAFAGRASAFARAFSGAAGDTGRTGGVSSTGAAGAGGFASRFAGAFGGATAGSISSVDGRTIYVRETSGNTVKVKLSSATTISKSERVSRKKLYPGDQVVVAGSSAKNGTVNATSVTDSGASSTGAGAGSSSSNSGSSSTSNTSSAISSLFGGGG